MSLATRCTACGTVFRVVQDQLKVSEGWVRCGRCHEVFNALEGLFDLEREAPPSWPPAPEPSSAPPPAAPAPVAPSRDAGTAGLETHPLLRGDDSETPQDFADARFPSELPDTQALDTQAQETRAGDTQAPPPGEPVEPAPQFLRAAERAAQWQRPRVRAGLALLLLLLAAALALQAAFHFRDTIAATWPRAQPALAALCRAADCPIEPPRRIERLAVESSGLVKIDGEGLYRFDVVLRNNGSGDVRLPAVDVSLTDAQGQLVARKVIPAAQLGATAPALAGGAELPLRAVLAVSGRRVAGYTIEIFYP